ncbi:MAG: uroporphyrinogen decarboxylase family protein [Candidatus Hodarchaeota archaeon]
MQQLTPYQRVMAVLEGKLPDRVPVIPQITYTTAQLTGVGLVEALHSPEKTAKTLLTGQRELGYDAIYAGWESSFNLLAEAMGCVMRFPEDSVPQVAEHIIKGPQDVDALEIPDPMRTGRLPLHMEMLKLIKTEVKGQVPIFVYTPGPFTLAGQLCGVNTLMTATIQDPQFVKALVYKTTVASTLYARANVKEGADVIVTADPTASGSLISPTTFSTFAAPHLRHIASAVNKVRAIPSLHICGKTTPLLKLMADTGARMLEVDHLVNLDEAKQLVGDRVILMGNLNPTNLLLSGTPEQVEQAAKISIETFRGDGRYILSSGCEVPPQAPLENIRAMVRAAEKYGKFS